MKDTIILPVETEKEAITRMQKANPYESSKHHWKCSCWRCEDAEEMEKAALEESQA